MLKTPGSNNLVKKVFSIEGLVFLVALVALGLSIAAMVKDCGEGFGDTQQVGCNTQPWVKNLHGDDDDERRKITKFCSSCKDPNGMNPNACNPSHCKKSHSVCSGYDPKNCGEGCYYSRSTGTCSYLDYNSLCTDSDGPSPSSQCVAGCTVKPGGKCIIDHGKKCNPDVDCCADPGHKCKPRKYDPTYRCQSGIGKQHNKGDIYSNCNDDTDCESGYTCQKNPHPNPYTDLSDKICLKSPPVPPFVPGFKPKERKHSDDSHKGLNQVQVMDGDSDNDEVGSSKGNGPTPGPPGNKGLTTGEIVGISVGGGLGLIVFIAIIWYVMKNKKPKIA